MNPRMICLFIFLLCGSQVVSQFKYDNVLYKTVYINDLCDALQKNPNHLLLDVRSPGEYSDTSSSASLNIGHLKGARNLDINEKEKRYSELLPYKDVPIFIYCSHSQRSRVFSKFLADSGFTKVYNVNGAMTEFNLLKYSNIECTKELYETNNKFSLISPQQVAKLIKSEKKLFILDVRSDSVFRGISTDAQANAQGKLKGAVNIPFTQLPNDLSKVPADRPVLVISDYGRETNLAAKLLTDKGYKQVYAAFNGMNQWISIPARELPERKELWQQNNSCAMITAEEMDAMVKKSSDIFFLDVRPTEEFTNQVKKEFWKNRGHIQNAVNIPANELESRIGEISDKKNMDIILYTFNTSREVFESANLLTAKGFKKVYVLTGGLWDVRWKGANLKGQEHLMKYVVDVPPDNQ